MNTKLSEDIAQARREVDRLYRVVWIHLDEYLAAVDKYERLCGHPLGEEPKTDLQPSRGGVTV